MGYGVDENTALVVEGNKATVLGENGVFIIDMQAASKMAD
jgi:cyanophycinase-like exopeptidase